VSGFFQRKRGVRSGLPDVLVLYGGSLIFIELKSRRGVPATRKRRFAPKCSLPPLSRGLQEVHVLR
jgi:hypothetical protein